jgi:hypothetical protein
MLADQTYLGRVIWCRRPHDKHERKEIKIRPESEWVVRKNAHEPLITWEAFERVQARLAGNRARTAGGGGCGGDGGGDGRTGSEDGAAPPSLATHTG